MADPTLKLELPCPRCGMLNSPAAVHCRQCAQGLEAAIMPDWPQPAPFDLPGAAAPCAACGKPNAADATMCVHCGEAPSGLGLVDDAVVKAVRPRPRKRRTAVGPLLNYAGWSRMATLIRVAALAFLAWGIVDSTIWLNGVNAHLAPEDPKALRYTLYAIYELVRNAVIVGAVWLATSLRTQSDA